MEENLERQVASQMYYNLCSELSDIARQNEGKKLNETDEYERVKEILKLTELLGKEYDIIT